MSSGDDVRTINNVLHDVTYLFKCCTDIQIESKKRGKANRHRQSQSQRQKKGCGREGEREREGVGWGRGWGGSTVPFMHMIESLYLLLKV